MKWIVLIAASAFILTACGQKQGSDAMPTAAPPQEPTPQYTKKEWRSALKSTFEEKNVKTDNDGITEYSACFKKNENGSCALFAFGKRDAFRRIDHLTPANTQLNNIGNHYKHVGTYIAAIECEAPILLVAPTINIRGGWLFMEKVAFMADSEVVVERSFEHNSVDRDNDDSWIHEKTTFIPSPEELKALRKFSNAESQIIRVTGKNGYLTLPKDRTSDFVSDIKQALTMLDILNAAFNNNGGPTCTRPAESRGT